MNGTLFIIRCDVAMAFNKESVKDCRCEIKNYFNISILYTFIINNRTLVRFKYLSLSLKYIATYVFI